MREVHDLASGMKEAIASIRQQSADAKASLHAEVARANENVAKVNALTEGLKEANKEVEGILADSGTNFPPITPKMAPIGQVMNKTDINGVTLNKELQK